MVKLKWTNIVSVDHQLTKEIEKHKFIANKMSNKLQLHEILQGVTEELDSLRHSFWHLLKQTSFQLGT